MIMTRNTEDRRDSTLFRSNPVAWVVCALVLGVASIAVPVPLLLTGVGVSALFILALRELSFGVLAILGSIPIQSAAAVEFGTTAVTWTKLAVATTIAAWLVRLLVGRSRPRVNGIANINRIYVGQVLMIPDFTTQA